jgi:LysM repeat protein
LVIKGSIVTPSATPRPLSPVEKLTPAADGKYYHEVQSGETLSWIATLYEVQVSSLMGWNGLNEASIIQPKQKLLLQVTPPATITPTSAPSTITPTFTGVPPTPSATTAPSSTQVIPTVAGAAAESASSQIPVVGYALLGLGLFGALLVVLAIRRK